MKNFKIIGCAIVLGLLIGGLAGCEYDEVLPEQPPSTDLSFQADILPIFNEGCNTSGCHGVGEFKPDLSPANAYTALFEGSYIDTIVPENSLLYRWMLGDEGAPMPPTGTDAFYNASVLKWISEGAKDN